MADTAQNATFYLTTPIYYVNARPHIGHAYSTIVGDVIARRHRLLGDDTFYLTGTDEHGQKIERSAAAAGVPPQEFADQVSKTFSDLWARMGITNDGFIRTTSECHKVGVQKLFRTLYENGYIELKAYTGQYCVSDEAFVDVPPGGYCPDCGRLTETLTEENFFFQLSKFQRQLIELIEGDNPELRIEPVSRRNEVLNFLIGDFRPLNDEYQQLKLSMLEAEFLNNPQASEGFGVGDDGIARAGSDGLDFYYWAATAEKVGQTKGGTFYVPGALKDLSISRSSFTWGVPVPEPAASTASQDHVIYVWLDALANYMTAVGYGSDDPKDAEKFERYWPADIHLVGKEIIRFHCVYWPAFLMAAELPLPKSIVANGWLLFEESKMSKSKGNVVRTETILDAFGGLKPELEKKEQDLFGADVLRYFLLREIPFGQDGSFSFDALVTRYNADLANGYGNLVSRTLSMIAKYFPDNKLMNPDEYPEPLPEGPDDDFKLTSSSSTIIDIAPKWLEEARQMELEADFSGALQLSWKFITMVDLYISNNHPWRPGMSSEAGDQFARAEILYTAAESLRLLTAALYPVMPYATAKVWEQLGLGDIEAAAKNGELKNLEWGGLKPGTKLGVLSPIFPRADKGLVQVMSEVEANKVVPKSAFTDENAPAAHVTEGTHPAAGPRVIEGDGSHVAGSAAETTERVSTPSHTEAAASGIFAASAHLSDDGAVAKMGHPVVPDTPQIAIDDFVKVDLRVAQIVVAERIPKADKLLRLEVDLGYEKRQILSGIAEWYTPEELIGRKIVIIANLAPRKMRGLESRGMLLAASEGENGKPVLATFGEEIAVGTRLR